MKFITLLCDGMADLPLENFQMKTPMELAKKPQMDSLAKKSEQGLVKTVGYNLLPGSDVANLSVMGYDPSVYYSGRSPLEAASIGIDMKKTDVSLRCNLVTLSDDMNYSDKTMLDYCADDISTADAKILIDFIEEKLGSDLFKFYSGVSYRHCLIWDNGTTDVGTLTPPHDISDRKITDYLDVNKNGEILIQLMEKSYELLKNHPLNLERIKKGKKSANSIWLWGEGVSKQLPSFTGKYGLKGAMISAVDLLKGIGKLAGMTVLNVSGATGYIDTDFDGKAKAAIDALENGHDFVYIHVEAPDECGHRGETENKIKAIELIDEKILLPLLQHFKDEEIKILICPDHPTPLSLKTHTRTAVPYLIYDSRCEKEGFSEFSEKFAAKGNYIEVGHTLMDRFLEKKI